MLIIAKNKNEKGWVKTVMSYSFLDFVRLIRTHRYIYPYRFYFLDLRNIRLPEKPSGKKIYTADSNFMSVFRTLEKIEINSNFLKTGSKGVRIYDPNKVK